MNMYYIAIVAPEEINQQVVKWKNFFKENFACTVALKSPAHITLIPPFWMKEELETELINAITSFCGGLHKFELMLKDFGAFPPKVIFVEVVRIEMLDKLHRSFNDFIYEQDKFPVKKDDRPFHPHITLATRDLFKKAFHEAWETFSVKKYEAVWKINSISLLKHNKKNWDVLFTSQTED